MVVVAIGVQAALHGTAVSIGGPNGLFEVATPITIVVAAVLGAALAKRVPVATAFGVGAAIGLIAASTCLLIAAQTGATDPQPVILRVASSSVFGSLGVGGSWLYSNHIQKKS